MTAAAQPTNLLRNIFYGYEITNKVIATRLLRKRFLMLSDEQIDRVYDSVVEYHSRIYDGVFGGQITAGDALMIAAMMEWKRPKSMIEVGVASGFSSAFILYHARKMGLLSEGVYLKSFDLMETHANGNKTGQFLYDYFGELDQYWSLNTERTTKDILKTPDLLAGIDLTSTLVFIDGGHDHPWPALDLLVMRKLLPRETWVVMQDVQMMERWIADCVRFNVASPAPIRGVNLAFSLWPGEKIVGHDLCYNSSALSLDITPQAAAHFAQQLHLYADETPAFDYSVFDHTLC